MATKVILEVTPTEAGEISVALQSWQMDVSDNGEDLRAHRIGLLLDKLSDARTKAGAWPS